MQRIVIDPVTRIEGHAKITIHLDDQDRVTDARFHVTEFRGFEAFCVGRPFTEMAGLSARVLVGGAWFLAVEALDLAAWRGPADALLALAYTAIGQLRPAVGQAEPGDHFVEDQKRTMT